MHEAAFKLAERSEKSGIITNQPIDCRALYMWALKKKYRHLMRIALRERVVVETSLNALLSYRNSVVIFDEAGIFANSRDWQEIKSRNPNLIVDLCQVRKGGIDLIWAAQNHEMVDKQIRMLTNFYYRCNSLKRVFRRYKFDPKGFVAWDNGGKIGKYCIGMEFGIFDSDIFKIYDSYVRLEDPANKGKDIVEVVAARKGAITTQQSVIQYDPRSEQYFIPDPDTGRRPHVPPVHRQAVKRRRGLSLPQLIGSR